MRKEKETSEPKRGSTSRRRFTKGVAAALVAAPIVVAATRRSGAQQPTPTTKEPKSPPNPQPTPTPAPRPSPVAEAYAEVARARFGKQLKDDEMKRVRRDIEGNVRVAERLSAVKLQNSDEPDFVFNA